VARKKLPASVHIKAAHLMKEGKTRDEAYGEATGMWEEGRLTREGKYKRGKKKARKKSFSETVLDQD
jgi:hypothetical protein